VPVRAPHVDVARDDTLPARRAPETLQEPSREVHPASPSAFHAVRFVAGAGGRLRGPNCGRRATGGSGAAVTMGAMLLPAARATPAGARPDGLAVRADDRRAATGRRR
jgi:hypothetical protein